MQEGLRFTADLAHAPATTDSQQKGDVMRGRVQKPFGLGGDIGLHVSSAARDAPETGWRISADRGRPRSALPRIGQILLAILVVAAMAAGLDVFLR